MSTIKKIHKYQVESRLMLPKDAKILTVALQDGKPMLWAEVDQTATEVARHFIFVPTGGVVPPNGTYLQTIFWDWLVWHVYELGGPPDNKK